MFNWALYGVLCVQICGCSSCIVTSEFLTSIRTDVYSYNFSDDRKAIKFLGEKRTFSKRNDPYLQHLTSLLRLSYRDGADSPYRW
jgi:hypothetical protein